MNKTALALDPNLLTGWAIGTRDVVFQSGVWDLDSGKRRSGAGMRYLILEQELESLLQGARVLPDLIVYEEIRRHSGTDASHVYGGCQAEIQKVATKLEIPWLSVPVSHIKIQATGKGNANKDAMIRTAQAKWRFPIIDDNHADALWLLDYATQEILK